jgi:hypothetical protein
MSPDPSGADLRESCRHPIDVAARDSPHCIVSFTPLTSAPPRNGAYGVFSPGNHGCGSRLPFRRHIFCWGIPTETGRSGPSRSAPKNRAMSRFNRALSLTLLITLLALPASAVTSSRISQNSTRSFLSALWSTLTSFFSSETTDGRCGADPWGICTGGDTTNQLATVDPVG